MKGSQTIMTFPFIPNFCFNLVTKENSKFKMFTRSNDIYRVEILNKTLNDDEFKRLDQYNEITQKKLGSL